MQGATMKCLVLLALVALMNFSAFNHAEEVPSFYATEVDRFEKLIADKSDLARLEGVKGLSGLKHWPSEERLFPLLSDSSADVRLESATALGRLGSKRCIPLLISLLTDDSWEVRMASHAALSAITAKELPLDETRWRNWWKDNHSIDLVPGLLAKIAGPSSPERETSVRALRHLAEPEDERHCLELPRQAGKLKLAPHEQSLLCEALERIGTTNAIPVLAKIRSDAAAWALGSIGGGDAEAALLHFRRNSATLLNLDRIGSTNCGSFLPHLVHSFGLVTYRAHPDDLDLPTSQPIQRVAANLILRSGRAPVLVEATLRELEATMDPPIRREPVMEIPPDIAGMLKRMREELKPGFVRGDGETTSQPVVALYHLVNDPSVAPRLIPILRHPAFVPRIYAAMLLGKLKSEDAVGEMIEIIRQGYHFSDATALASGKHFDQSQTVRWRGFLCMALGKIGTEPARIALEDFASDPDQPRDVRYGAVIGLGFIQHPGSREILAEIARQDLIWMNRDAARRALERLNQQQPGLAIVNP